ncbi:MAG: L-serine ammonia-lyase, iron-sulfur-dependent, subunit alpha [Clostridium sp.]
MAYYSLESILEVCKVKQISFDQAIQMDDAEEREVTMEQSFREMTEIWGAMKHSSASYDPDLKSVSGLSGGQGKQMEQYGKSSDTLCGPFMNRVMCQALQMAESNACMKCIVAAPTAGSCGVLPAVLIPYFEQYKTTDHEMVQALYVAAGIGQVIAERASISGAAGGCQAEIGSASAMAAGALTALRGGTPDMIADAAAIALKCLLGLVCDPVAGLVEVPCVKRNVLGAVNAMTSADMVLAGIKSFIPADQVFDAMKEVGDKMDTSLRETGTGGLAATKTAMELVDKLKMN